MLIGVGLGPGDPSLLTLRAVETLQSATKVFVPGRLAFDLVAPYTVAEVLDFPMTHDVEQLQRAWNQHVEKIARYAADTLTVFAVIGDPNVFSTFSHVATLMRRKNPDIKIATVPGVSAITACFSRFNEHVGDSFIVSDDSPVESKLFLKATRPREIASAFRDEGFTNLMLLEQGFTKKEKVYTENFPLKGKYFSILYGKRE